MSIASPYAADSPSSATATPPPSASQTSPHAHAYSPPLRSVPESDASSPDPAPVHSFTRPPKIPTLPDPSQFPDPYPFRPPHHHLTSTPPALSSAGSSSASTRSSAYTSYGSALASGDYGHVHVVSGEEDAVTGVGITSDDVVQLLASDSNASSSSSQSYRAPILDQTRWSETYSASLRSRSSSLGHSNTNSMHEAPAPPTLHQKPSYDMGWQSVDERDEAGLVSDEDSDDDHILGDQDEDEEEEEEEERTNAIMIAEEGRGLIVKGDGLAISQLHVQPGTTHLLVGSSSTPNALPSFMTNTLPQISSTLLALDISANFLGALPPALAMCTNLEELNVASNPLRVLPVFLCELTSLRVLIADATGLTTLPESLSELDKLHTLSVRRNKMNSLPSWLCLLPSLQTLYVDGNPFHGPWKALVEPLLTRTPMPPSYPPSTPVFPLPSASLASSSAGGDTDTDDLSDPPFGEPSTWRNSPEEEDTITPERAPHLGRSTTSPFPVPAREPDAEETRGLQRTRTTPNRAFYANTRNQLPVRIDSIALGSGTLSANRSEGPGFGEPEVRRMKSAGDLRGGLMSPSSPSFPPPMSPASPPRPDLHYPPSASSSNFLRAGNEMPSSERILPKRYASVGVVGGGSPSRNGARPALTQSLWDNISENGDDDSAVQPDTKRISFSSSSSTTSPPQVRRMDSRQANSRPLSGKDGKEKNGRWGFFKKMSMGKMRGDSPSASRPGTPSNDRRPPPVPRPPNITIGGPPVAAVGQAPVPGARPRPLGVTSPQIDMRFSTTGNLDAAPIPPAPSFAVSPPNTEQDKAPETSTDANSHTSNSLLSAPSPTTRSSRRRSFLPIDLPGALSLPVPSPPPITSITTGPIDADESDESQRATPSPAFDYEQQVRKEEERAREAYTRALRSVMAYLKDMNDLGSSQPNPVSMYGSSSDEAVGTGMRSRRPTVVEQNRVTSDGSNASGSGTISRSGSTAQLRSAESMAGLRDGNAANTYSVASTDSNGSGEDRKFKDDKGKRAMVIREIVETERTYVKGLQELVDIYIKPGCAPVNMLSGVGSTKDTVVPASERKVVFSGVDALFSFHKESFLPALETAAAPLMKPPAMLKEADAHGQLSRDVVTAVASMFLKHAAFMKMYSTYINNFDNSVQRVKHWTSNRPNTPGSTTPANPTPSSSNVQLVGLGLSLSAVSTPAAASDASSSTGLASLSTGQKKRIKTYLKRCRMNPRHSQLNLEGYLLLPVQRIPRYKLLLEELLRSTPPVSEYMEDPLDKALAEISSLASNMNEGKRESESRRKLVQWQTRIRGKFPSPLVQPHRRLIMDGPLLLTRVVRKAVLSFEAFNAQGDASTVQVDCLAPELTPRSLVGILCNDLLVLCRDPSEGKDPTCYVDLWAVLRMQTLPQPASIVHGNALRLVDNKAILYFDAPSPSDALNWFRAINLHIPASKT
ncbi:hypothetical protein PLICRDRAFT_99859 [Plicaturopsis crispa FD-325 SS-3]|nr:hypothetical protein PLICRDRAFT_99859 [Plicaturopsis crispa FD-325 SS-3]